MKPAIFNNLLPQAFVFDWDNTLVDSWPAIMEAINLTRVNFGLSAWSIDGIMANCTRSARESFPEWFGDQWKDAYDFYYRNFDVVRQRCAIKPLSGAEELLLWLKEKQIPAFVVSNKRGDYLRYEAQKLGWDKHFIALIGATDAPFDKPHRAHVDFALEKGGITAHEHVWFVGDSEADIACARNSGCTPILIGHADIAAKLGVAHVFADCAAILEHLQ